MFRKIRPFGYAGGMPILQKALLGHAEVIGESRPQDRSRA